MGTRLLIKNARLSWKQGAKAEFLFSTAQELFLDILEIRFIGHEDCR